MSYRNLWPFFGGPFCISACLLFANLGKTDETSKEPSYASSRKDDMPFMQYGLSEYQEPVMPTEEGKELNSFMTAFLGQNEQFTGYGGPESVFIKDLKSVLQLEELHIKEKYKVSKVPEEDLRSVRLLANPGLWPPDFLRFVYNELFHVPQNTPTKELPVEWQNGLRNWVYDYFEDDDKGQPTVLKKYRTKDSFSLSLEVGLRQAIQKYVDEYVYPLSSYNWKRLHDKTSAMDLSLLGTDPDKLTSQQQLIKDWAQAAYAVDKERCKDLDWQTFIEEPGATGVHKFYGSPKTINNDCIKNGNKFYIDIQAALDPNFMGSIMGPLFQYGKKYQTNGMSVDLNNWSEMYHQAVLGEHNALYSQVSYACAKYDYDPQDDAFNKAVFTDDPVKSQPARQAKDYMQSMVDLKKKNQNTIQSIQTYQNKISLLQLQINSVKNQLANLPTTQAPPADNAANPQSLDQQRTQLAGQLRSLQIDLDLSKSMKQQYLAKKQELDMAFETNFHAPQNSNIPIYQDRNEYMRRYKMAIDECLQKYMAEEMKKALKVDYEKYEPTNAQDIKYLKALEADPNERETHSYELTGHGPAYLKYHEDSQLTGEELEKLEVCIERKIVAMLNQKTPVQGDFEKAAKEVPHSCSDEVIGVSDRRLFKKALEFANQSYENQMSRRWERYARNMRFSGEESVYDKNLRLLALQSTDAEAVKKRSEELQNAAKIQAQNLPIIQELTTKYGISIEKSDTHEVNAEALIRKLNAISKNPNSTEADFSFLTDIYTPKPTDEHIQSLQHYLEALLGPDNFKNFQDQVKALHQLYLEKKGFRKLTHAELARYIDYVKANIYDFDEDNKPLVAQLGELEKQLDHPIKPDEQEDYYEDKPLFPDQDAQRSEDFAHSASTVSLADLRNVISKSLKNEQQKSDIMSYLAHPNLYVGDTVVVDNAVHSDETMPYLDTAYSRAVVSQIKKAQDQTEAFVDELAKSADKYTTKLTAVKRIANFVSEIDNLFLKEDKTKVDPYFCPHNPLQCLELIEDLRLKYGDATHTAHTQVVGPGLGSLTVTDTAKTTNSPEWEKALSGKLDETIKELEENGRVAEANDIKNRKAQIIQRFINSYSTEIRMANNRVKAESEWRLNFLKLSTLFDIPSLEGKYGLGRDDSPQHEPLRQRVENFKQTAINMEKWLEDHKGKIDDKARTVMVHTILVDGVGQIAAFYLTLGASSLVVGGLRAAGWAVGELATAGAARMGLSRLVSFAEARALPFAGDAIATTGARYGLQHVGKSVFWMLKGLGTAQSLTDAYFKTHDPKSPEFGNSYGESLMDEVLQASVLSGTDPSAEGFSGFVDNLKAFTLPIAMNAGMMGMFNFSQRGAKRLISSFSPRMREYASFMEELKLLTSKRAMGTLTQAEAALLKDMELIHGQMWNGMRREGKLTFDASGDLSMSSLDKRYEKAANLATGAVNAGYMWWSHSTQYEAQQKQYLGAAKKIRDEAAAMPEGPNKQSALIKAADLEKIAAVERAKYEGQVKVTLIPGLPPITISAKVYNVAVWDIGFTWMSSGAASHYEQKPLSSGEAIAALRAELFQDAHPDYRKAPRATPESLLENLSKPLTIDQRVALRSTKPSKVLMSDADYQSYLAGMMRIKQSVNPVDLPKVDFASVSKVTKHQGYVELEFSPLLYEDALAGGKKNQKIMAMNEKLMQRGWVSYDEVMDLIADQQLTPKPPAPQPPGPPPPSRFPSQTK